MSAVSLNSEYLIFQKSLGYDCLKNQNLIQIDSNTLAFASGNFLHFLDVSTKQISSRRSISNAGIACLTKNPILNHLTVGEYGTPSTVYIYGNYPSLEILAKCSNGSSSSQIRCMAYNSDGDLLAQQDNGPDYTLTVWDWTTMTILLRAQCNAATTNTIQFSQFNRNCLVTGGVDYIRFWDLSHTFTGPKLQRNHGRFGKYDECNIMAIRTLADDRTLSNCDGGNLLVWENGAVKFEVCQKNRRPCHRQTITQIYCDGDRVVSVGLDGFVRIWFWDTIAATRNSPEGKYFEIDATYEYEIGSDGYKCAILSMVRNSATDNRWFAQDANGGIWMCDLQPGTDSCQSQVIYRCHAGAIYDVATSPIPYCDYIASLGEDGRLHVHNSSDGNLAFIHQFGAAGRSMIWLRDPFDGLIVMGFADGVIRVMAIDILRRRLRLIEVSKPNHKSITKISVNPTASTLVTAAEDESIFIYRIGRPFKLNPIGLVKLSSVATDFAWYPNNDKIVFAGSKRTKLFKISISDDLQASQTSYQLNHADLVQEIELIAHNDNAECIDALVHWMKFIADEVLWISLSNGDLFEFNCLVQSVSLVYAFHAAAMQACLTHDRKYIIFGLANGCVSVNQLTIKVSYNFIECQLLQMHDNQNGKITSLQFSLDQKQFFSTGVDGNLFVYSWKSLQPCLRPANAPNIDALNYPETDDICDTNRLSLEQEKTMAVAQANAERANRKKSDILEMINSLRIEFEVVNERNLRLPQSMQLSETDFEIDSRITDDIQAEIEHHMEADRVEHTAEMNKIRLQWSKIDTVLLNNVNCWAISLIGIRNNDSVETFFIEKISDHFEAVRLEFENRVDGLKNESVSTQPKSSEHGNDLIEPVRGNDVIPAMQTAGASSSMQYLFEFSDKGPLDVQTRRLLKKYKERKQLAIEREQKWKNILAKKPCPSVIDPAEIESFEQTKNAIGNLVLKSDPANIVIERNPEKLSVGKYLELKRMRDEIQQIKRNFNKEVFAARQQKLELCHYFNDQLKKLQAIQVEIPAAQMKTVKIIPSIDENVELLDRRFELASSIFNGETPVFNKFESVEETDVTSDYYQAVLEMRTAASSSKYNDTETELRQLRLTWKLFEQSVIIDGIDKRISMFDEHLSMLKNRRMEIALEVNFMELYYFTVYQELTVLKNFEKAQILLMEDIDAGRCELGRVQAMLNSEKVVLHELQQHASELEESSDGIELRFSECRGDDEFASLSEMVFRSNDLDEINLSTISTQLVEPVRNLREKRIKLDARMHQQSMLVATANEKIRQMAENSGAISKSLQGNEYALKMLLHEKHKQLNNVDTIIVLRKDQLQHENSGDSDDYIVVNNDTITKLYQRINQLALETAEEQASERFYVNQLAKIKADCTATAKAISTTASCVKDAMIRKFGQEIDLDEMEETILARLVCMDSGDQDNSKRQSKLVQELRNRLLEKDKELLQLKQTNVEKFNLLTELQEEKNIIEYQLRFQERLRAKRTPDINQVNTDKDLRRLRAICRQQQQQLKSIDNEIQALRMKAKPLEPLNFADAMRRAQNFQPEHFEHVVNITAPESLHSTNSASSDTSSQHEEAISKVAECVAHFLKRHLAIPLDDAALNAYAMEIGAYFVKQFSHYYYQLQQSDQMLRKTIENLKNFVPDASLGHIGATEYVQLYAEIRQFLPNANDDDTSRFSLIELLRSIFDEVVTAIPPSIDDYSNFLLSEFFRESFAVVPLGDAKKIDQLNVCLSLFRRQPRFVVADIEVERCVTQLWKHKDTFMTHEINEQEFSRLISHLIDQIKT